MSVRRTELGHHLVRLFKVIKTLRADAIPPSAGVDPAAYGVLFPLERESLRLSDLASCTHSDLSTVSRQVSALTASGHIEKVRDTNDGRAQLLVLTDRGVSLLADLREHRDAFLTTLLDDWDDSDVAALAGYLDRFATDAERWLTARQTPKDPA